jgi:hypothetical protein
MVAAGSAESQQPLPTKTENSDLPWLGHPFWIAR